MKIIKYKLLSSEINRGTDEKPLIEQIFREKEIRCAAVDLEANEGIAKMEAYNGEYTIEDDDVEETVVPTSDERLAALEAAMLEMMGVTSDG